MQQKFKLTLAQLNAKVGDLSGNCEQAFQAWEAATAANSDMVMLPEMFATGYQVQDLVMKPAFLKDTIAHIDSLAKRCANGPTMGIGGPSRDAHGLYNAYYILSGGSIQVIVRKHNLPNRTWLL